MEKSFKLVSSFMCSRFCVQTCVFNVLISWLTLVELCFSVCDMSQWCMHSNRCNQSPSRHTPDSHRDQHQPNRTHCQSTGCAVLVGSELRLGGFSPTDAFAAWVLLAGAAEMPGSCLDATSKASADIAAHCTHSLSFCKCMQIALAASPSMFFCQLGAFRQ